MFNKVDYLLESTKYEPRSADLEKVKHYVNVE